MLLYLMHFSQLYTHDQVSVTVRTKQHPIHILSVVAFNSQGGAGRSIIVNRNLSGSGPVCGSGAILVPEGACCECVDKFSPVSAQSGSLSSAREN